MRVFVIVLCWSGWCACVGGSRFFFLPRTTLCAHSKRSRVYFGDAPACAVKTPVSYVALNDNGNDHSYSELSILATVLAWTLAPSLFSEMFTPC